MIYLSRISFLIFLLSSVACSSPSVHYHTLVSPPSAIAEPVPAAPFFIAVLPVAVPPQIDLPQLVVRQGESDAMILKTERWLSPLGDEVRSALSVDLSQRLSTQDVAGLAYAGETQTPVIKIQVQLRRFESWPGRSVNLDASWSLGSQGLRLVCFSQLVEPIGPGYTEMFLAQQRIISRLSANIALTARHWAQDPHRGCME